MTYPPRYAPALSGWLLVLVPVSGALGACCTTVPSNAQLLQTSFRTPEATLESFRLAWRCDEPDLEYRCLSVRFTAELGLSQLAWREARAEVLRDSGLSSLFVDRLQPTSPARIRGDEAWLEVGSLGKTLQLHFVRESVGRVWANGKLVADEDLDWSSAVGTQLVEDKPHAWGRLPAAAAPDQIDELRLSREWKLDGLVQP